MRACVRVWVYAVRIVSTHRSLRFIKTFIIIIKISDVTVADYTALQERARERERERDRETETDRDRDRDRETPRQCAYTTHWGRKPGDRRPRIFSFH